MHSPSTSREQPSQGEYITTERAAELLSLSPTYLRQLRCKRSDGPRFVKLGAAVRYRRSDLIAWAEANAATSTSGRG